MTDDQPRLSDYLDHVVQAIDRIARYTENVDELAFLQQELVQDAVIRNIEVIGEACRNIDKHFPNLPPTTRNYRWRSLTRCAT